VRRKGGTWWRGLLLGLGAGISLAVAPAMAAADTVGNGVYTADPNHGGGIHVSFDPNTAAYRFQGFDPTDSDGPGGCYLSGYYAYCPAAETSRIVINAGDGRNYISIGPNGFDVPFGLFGLTDANRVHIPVEIHAGGGIDIIAGGEGPDVIDGGPGSDLIDGNEHDYAIGASGGNESQVQERDVISCGVGDDAGSNGFTFEDTADLGAGDVVTSDCETVQQMATCPAKGPDCFVTTPVEAVVAGSGGATAAASSGRTVLLGVGHKKLQSGQGSPVITRLRPKRVRRVLRHTRSVRASLSVVAKRHGTSRRLHRTRFHLAKLG
jgi:Ca2+-binding RTX toxin-like protein